MSQTIDKLLAALKLSEELVNIECNVLVATIKLAKDVSKIVAEKRQEIAATNINVIDAAARGKLMETGHSRVLYNLLKNEEICKGFIKEFLPEEIAGKILDNGITKGVDREKQNIDISIFAYPYFIIIENKVNDAQEQPGQIYRYVQYGLQKKIEKDNIYVLYLNKDNNRPPRSYSLNKEGKEDGELAFPEDMMKKHVIPLSYKKNIYNWINNVYENEKKIYENVKENRESHEILFSALVQYKDYLENFFELTDKYDPMKKEINELLIKELELNDKSYSQKIEILENQIENADELKKRLDDLKKNIELQELNDRFNSRIQKEYEDIHIRTIPYTKDEDWPLFGIEFTINNIPVQCTAEINKNKPYYGIRYSGGDKNVKKEVENLYDNYIKKLDFIEGFKKKDDYYPIGKDCMINELVENTYKLAQKIIEIANNDPDSGFKLRYKEE